MPKRKGQKRKPEIRKELARLKPAHKVFALTYLANGNNGRAAYKEAFPSASRSDDVTDVMASRLLRADQVKAFIAERERVILAAAEATATEAMEVITRTIRLDPRLLIDKREGPNKGKPLPLEEWPDEVALVVKSIKQDGTVVFYDKMRAAELIAESHGKIKKKLDISLAFDHVKYLADLSRGKE